VPPEKVDTPAVPEAAIDIAPEVLVIAIPVPAVNVVLVKPVPLPISKAPFAGVVINPVPPLVTGKVPETPVVNGNPVQLINVPEVGVPKIGVINVGDVFSTFDPVPVDVITPVPPFAIGKVPATWVVKLTPLNVPPKVKLPAVVTTPLNVIPLTVPPPPTEVTVPDPPPPVAGADTQFVPVDVKTLPTVPGLVKPVPPDADGNDDIFPPNVKVVDPIVIGVEKFWSKSDKGI
jgi:hypothetical protein